jgi:putative ABC transport system permease protein
VLFIPMIADMRPNMPPAYFIVGIEPGREGAFLGELQAREGAVELSGSRKVILGTGAADHYRPSPDGGPAEPGDTVRILEEEFTVIGVLESASTLYNGTVIMPLATAQDLYNRPATVSAVILTPERMDNIGGIQDTIHGAYPNLQASNQEDIAKNAVDMMSMQRTFFSLINDSAVLSTVMVVMVVVLVAVMEQRKDIGALRAMGARKWRILGMVFGESLTMTLCGGLAALPISIATSAVLDYGLQYRWFETLQIWLGTLGVCLLIGVLAAILPAWQALRVDPLTAMQME